jgi:hypothetical protein
MCWCFWIAVVVASGVLFALIFPRFVERELASYAVPNHVRNDSAPGCLSASDGDASNCNTQSMACGRYFSAL